MQPLENIFPQWDVCKRAQEAFAQAVEFCPNKDAPLVIQEADPARYAGAFLAGWQMEQPTVLLPPTLSPAMQAQWQRLMPDPTQPLPALRGRFLIPTGGTGGRLKLAIHSRESLSAAAKGFQDFLGESHLNSVCTLPLHHVSGLMQLVRTLVTDGCIYFIDTKDFTKEKLPVLADKPWLLSLVPTQLHRLLQDAGAIEQLKAFRAILLGGAPARAETLSQARVQRLPIMPVYGMTETAAVCAAQRVEHFLAGEPLTLEPLPHCRYSEKDGALQVATPALFQGYFPEAPQPRQWHPTGDLGQVLANGRIELHGRADRLINTGGEKVDPRIVEEAILASGLAKEVRVFGEADAEWGQRVVAWVVPLERDVSTKQLQACLKESLPPAAVPKDIRLVSALPKPSKALENL